MPITFDPSEDDRPLWFPDGKRLVFWSNRAAAAGTGGPGFYHKASSGAGPDELLLPGVGPAGVPLGFSPDGHSLLYAAGGHENGVDLWTLPLVGDRKPVVVLQTPFHEGQAQISPDGKWLAYVSDETQQNNVYVKAFPSGDKSLAVSMNGGVEPKWGKNGSEIFYLAPDRYLMVVPFKTNPRVALGTPTQFVPDSNVPVRGYRVHNKPVRLRSKEPALPHQ
jgi:Tol biopolymer transport system component